MAITPDTKNWTWVLERPCPECGFDSRAFPREESGSRVRDIARSWQEILAAPAVAVRPSDDVWSPLEYGCHVRDVFRVFGERLDLMLTSDGASFANWDQDKTAVDDCYGEQDPAVVAGELHASAASIAARFDGVAGAQWSRTGARSDGSSFTVESLGRYLIHDPIHHLHDVRSSA